MLEILLELNTPLGYFGVFVVVVYWIWLPWLLHEIHKSGL